MSALSIDQQRLKKAVRDLQRAVGGVEAAAEITGKGKSQHGNYQSPNMPDFATIDAVAAMEAVSHGTPAHPAVTRLLCQMAGGVFVPLPQMPEGADAPALMLARLAAELGDVSRKITEGLADNGVLDPHEAEAALIEVGDLERLTAQLRMTLRGIADSGVA